MTEDPPIVAIPSYAEPIVHQRDPEQRLVRKMFDDRFHQCGAPVNPDSEFSRNWRMRVIGGEKKLEPFRCARKARYMVGEIGLCNIHAGAALLAMCLDLGI